MNRIFKVVFNHVLGRHVVVSEVASSIMRGACKAIATAAIAVAGLGFSAFAMAQTLPTNHDYGMSWDAAVVLTSEDGHIAIGIIRGDAGGGPSGMTATQLSNYLNDPANGYTDVAQNIMNVVNSAGTNNIGGRNYRYSLVTSEASANFTQVLEKEVLQTIGQALKPGENVVINVGDFQKQEIDGQLVYIDSNGDPLKKSDGTYVTDKADIPTKADGTPDAIVAEYQIHAADSKVTLLEKVGETSADGTTTYKLFGTEQTVTGEGENAKITTETGKELGTITDTNTTYTLAGATGKKIIPQQST